MHDPVEGTIKQYKLQEMYLFLHGTSNTSQCTLYRVYCTIIFIIYNHHQFSSLNNVDIMYNSVIGSSKCILQYKVQVMRIPVRGNIKSSSCTRQRNALSCKSNNYFIFRYKLSEIYLEIMYSILHPCIHNLKVHYEICQG